MEPSIVKINFICYYRKTCKQNHCIKYIIFSLKWPQNLQNVP